VYETAGMRIGRVIEVARNDEAATSVDIAAGHDPAECAIRDSNPEPAD
jgi:hypothetical protein